jgi:hypothetical protein
MTRFRRIRQAIRRLISKRIKADRWYQQVVTLDMANSYLNGYYAERAGIGWMKLANGWVVLPSTLHVTPYVMGWNDSKGKKPIDVSNLWREGKR